MWPWCGVFAVLLASYTLHRTTLRMSNHSEAHCSDKPVLWRLCYKEKRLSMFVRSCAKNVHLCRHSPCATTLEKTTLEGHRVILKCLLLRMICGLTVSLDNVPQLAADRWSLITLEGIWPVPLAPLWCMLRTMMSASWSVASRHNELPLCHESRQS